MKSAIFFVIAFATSVASATVNNYQWTCTGRQLVPGGIAQPHPVTINATENAIATFGNPWTFDFSFDGAKVPLFGKGNLCGTVIDADIDCVESSPSADRDTRLHSTGPFQLVSRCEDKKTPDVAPYRWTTAKIVMNADQTYGRFFCSSGRTGQSMTVELSNCSAK